MLIDVNTYIGHWPFRQIKNNTADSLVGLMDKYGIDIAVVSSVNSIFYKDTQQGNLELIDQISTYKDRFIPFAIINPAYTAWEKDFLYCIEHLGMKGLELYPYYHEYKLTDDTAVELLKIAAAKNIPVHLPCAIENIRQRHWMDTTKNLSIDELEKVLTLCPDTDFIITNGPTNVIAQRLKGVASKRPGRIYYDFARVDVFTPAFDMLVEAAGVDRVVFGSVAPFQYIDPQFVKIHFSKLNDNEKEKVMSGNLKELFGL